MIVHLTLRQAHAASALEGDPKLGLLLRDLDVVIAFMLMPHKVDDDELREPTRVIDLDPALIERLRARRAFLVIDHSDEGYAHRERFSEMVHAWCEATGVSPSRLVYLNQNRELPAQYAAWADERGLSDRYTVLAFDAWVYRLAVAVRILDRSTQESTLLHRRPREYRFLSFNYAPRAARIIIAAYLLRASPPDALVSLGPSKGPADAPARVTPESSLRIIEQRFRKRSMIESFPDLLDGIDVDDLRARTTLPPPERSQREDLPLRLDSEHYARSYVSVVTETEMSAGQIRRLTEKTIKPFLFGHLAVVAGNPGVLAIVRDLGFRTFEPLIDEAYDSIANPADRLAAMLTEVDRL